VLAATSGLGCAEEGTLARQAPELALNDAPLDFGTVPLGASKRIALEISNPGARTLVITEVSLAAPFSADLGATELAPGASARLDVAFSPRQVEPDRGVLELRTNATEAPVQIQLQGAGARAQLRVTPAAIDFGAVRLQSASVRELVLESASSAPIEARIVTDGFPFREHFELTFVPQFGDPAPLSLSGLDQKTLTLRFAPFVEGRNDGRLLFEFCGARCGVWVEVNAEASASRLRVEPAVLDFGQVGIDEARTEQLVVRNVGDEPYDVNEVLLRGSDELVFATDTPLPATLAADAFLTLRVTYAPFAARDAEGRLLIRTSDPAVGEVQVPIFGEGAGPRFVIQPEALNFGVVDVGLSERLLLLVNAGSSALSVQRLEFSGDLGFRLVDAPPLPVRLGPGDTSAVTVQLDAQRTGTFTGTVTIETSDASVPRAQVPVRGFRGDRLCRLEARPASFNFGVLPPGLERVASLSFENVGNEACGLESVALRAPADPFFRLIEAPRPSSLGPGEALEVEVAFAPAEERDAKAALVMATNDPLAPRLAVNLVGTGARYVDVFTEPLVVDFGALRPDCNEGVQSVFLRNAGGDAVRVASVRLDPPAPEVSLAGPQPLRVPNGASAGWTLGWRPSEPGVVRTDLMIDFEDLPFPLRVPVVGEASLDARATERFQQRDVARVDVLFVIDNSCSMQDDQDALAANAETFISEADLQSANYRIGVTTTSEWPAQGQLVGPVIDRERLNRSEVIAEFRAQTRVGTEGSGIEEGAASVLAALRRAQRGSSLNGELLRDGASLAVIIVTDEDDSSPASMLSYYRDIVAIAPNDLVFAIVSGGADGCGTALATPRYAELLTLTGGEHVSICDDWGQNLEALGQAAFAPLTRFELRSPPEPTVPIEVRIDGQGVDAAAWRRAPDSRVVEFDEPPPPNSVLEVSYVPQCR